MKKVLILFGGNSYEHEVSCKSVKNIIENIDKTEFDYEVVGISKDNHWYLYIDDIKYLDANWLDADLLEVTNIIEYLKKFDVIFPMIHGYFGEDGKLQGMLDSFNLKYVGSNTLTHAIAMDKAISKILFNHLGLKQVPYIIYNDDLNIDDIIAELSFPLIVKPANGGSSIGITKVMNKEELIDAIEEAQKYDSKIIIEKFIEARELECAILQKEDEYLVSNVGEIKINTSFYDFDSKYVNQESYTIINHDLKEEIKSYIRDSALKIFKFFGCRGYSRIDFFYDETTEEIYINEINTIPGFTSISMYPELIKDLGISYQELITILINNT